MAHLAWGVDARLTDRRDAIAQHSAAAARHRGPKQAAFVVLARDHAINALFGEKVGPAFEFVVERRGIVVVKAEQGEAQFAIRRGDHRPIT
jgi:predicted Fe-Mo cluster-binding NifX family protein